MKRKQSPSSHQSLSTPSWLNKIQQEVLRHSSNNNNLPQSKTTDSTTLQSRLAHLFVERAKLGQNNNNKKKSNNYDNNDSTINSLLLKIRNNIMKWWEHIRNNNNNTNYSETVYELLNRFNPIMNTFELIIYMFESVGLFSIAQFVYDLKRIVWLSFRFLWSLLFLFESGESRRRRIEGSIMRRSGSSTTSNNHYNQYYGQDPYYPGSMLNGSTSSAADGYYYGDRNIMQGSFNNSYIYADDPSPDLSGAMTNLYDDDPYIP